MSEMPQVIRTTDLCQQAHSYPVPERGITIRSGKDLLSLLREAQRWESAFESLSEWEGFLVVRDEAIGQLLRRLISESNVHERMIESMIRMVKTTTDSSPRVVDNSQLTLEGQDEMALLVRLQKSELMIHDLYQDIRTALETSDLETLMDPRNVPVFLKNLDSLVAAEAKHYELVTECIAKR
jgi:hypothetical protein